MKKLLWPLLLLSVPFGALAQSDEGEEGGEGGPPRWSVGIVAVVNDSPYAGEGSRVMPFPLVSFEGERFFFNGISAGWRIMNKESFELSAVAKLRLDGFKVDDLGRAELAANGINYQRLEDRDMAVDLGLAMKWSGKAGEFEAELLADASGTSGGQEVSLQYGYPFQVGKGALTPIAGITWQSKDMANYYYGTLDEEVARGVVNYKPGAVTMPFVGVQYFRPIGEKWSLMAVAKFSSLPDEIQNSPLIQRGTKDTSSVFIGFSRGF